MSGQNSFLSFANFVKTALTGSGITVDIEKDEAMVAPYLIIQKGPSGTTAVSEQMVQAWLVVERSTTEPLVVTAGRFLQQVVNVTKDAGYIELYDYDQTPKKLVGSFLIKKDIQVSVDLSDDAKRSRNVITWTLQSNA